MLFFGTARNLKCVPVWYRKRAPVVEIQKRTAVQHAAVTTSGLHQGLGKRRIISCRRKVWIYQVAMRAMYFDAIKARHAEDLFSKLAAHPGSERVTHPQDGKIDPVVRMVDSTVGKMLDQQSDINSRCGNIADADMVAEFESRG